MNEQEQENFQGAAIATITVDLASLLTDKRFLGEDYDGDNVYSSSVLQQIVKAAGAQLVKQVLTDDFRKALNEQVTTQVAEAVKAALDEPVQRTDSYGRTQGEIRSLRDLITDDATTQVVKWTKAGSTFEKSGYDKFIREIVDTAIRTDLNETVKKLREDIKKRMEAAGAKAIADAAASLVGVKR